MWEERTSSLDQQALNGRMVILCATLAAADAIVSFERAEINVNVFGYVLNEERRPKVLHLKLSLM